METVDRLYQFPMISSDTYEPSSKLRDRESEVRNPVWMPTELETQ
jgi:hypothetical protein